MRLISSTTTLTPWMSTWRSTSAGSSKYRSYENPAQPPPTTRSRSAMVASIVSASRISLTLEAATGLVGTIDSGPGAASGGGPAEGVVGAVAVASSDIFKSSWAIYGDGTPYPHVRVMAIYRGGDL